MNKLLSTLNNPFLMLLMVVLVLAGIIVISRPLIDDLRCKYIIKKHSKTFYKAFSQLESKTKKRPFMPFTHFVEWQTIMWMRIMISRNSFDWKHN
ncbi:MAG: hypothetical protein RBQ91_04750 [Acholeplasma sp.]|nr:hypothetical protein [Acholeplasma sp.]